MKIKSLNPIVRPSNAVLSLSWEDPEFSEALSYYRYLNYGPLFLFDRQDINDVITGWGALTGAVRVPQQNGTWPPLLCWYPISTCVLIISLTWLLSAIFPYQVIRQIVLVPVSIIHIFIIFFLFPLILKFRWWVKTSFHLDPNARPAMRRRLQIPPPPSHFPQKVLPLLPT